MLANRRIPGEVRKIIREPLIVRASVPHMLDTTDELSIEDVCIMRFYHVICTLFICFYHVKFVQFKIQSKMGEIQHELQSLTYQYENLDRKSNDYLNERKRIAIRLDSLRREFRSLLVKIQTKQCQEAQTIPSDDVSCYLKIDFNEKQN